MRAVVLTRPCRRSGVIFWRSVIAVSATTMNARYHRPTISAAASHWLSTAQPMTHSTEAGRATAATSPSPNRREMGGNTTLPASPPSPMTIHMRPKRGSPPGRTPRTWSIQGMSWPRNAAAAALDSPAMSVVVRTSRLPSRNRKPSRMSPTRSPRVAVSPP